MVFEHVRRPAMKAADRRTVTGRTPARAHSLVATQILCRHQAGTQFAPSQRSQRQRDIARIERARIGKSHIHEAVLPERG